MLIARTGQELAAATATLRAEQGSLTLVPTMGALHDGHLALVHAARAHRGAAAASIFVNPTQFGPSEDFSRYPRDQDADLQKLRGAGCDLAWLPAPEHIYPPGDATLVDPSGPAIGWEGEIRPGHFRGVATVVAKLFGHVRPDAALFGEKDWQQLQVIRRMTTDLMLPVRILAAPTVREADGLALSSRNRFLSVAERAAAPGLYAALCRSAAAVIAGEAIADILHSARQTLEDAGMGVDYFALVDGASLRNVTPPHSNARLIAAVRLGRVRLLDNVAVGNPAR